MNTPDSYPSDQSELAHAGTASSVLSWRQALAIGTASAVLAGGAVGCGTSPRYDRETADVPAADFPFESNTLGTDGPIQDPETTAKKERRINLFGPCYEGRSQAFRELYAKACINAKEYGRVALVVFDMPESQAEEMASGIERITSAATEGLVNVAVDVVPAPQESLTEVSLKTEDVCVNTREIREFTSVLAEQAAPETFEGYDFVLSAAELLSCDDLEPNTKHNIQGWATYIGGRHADVFIPAIAEEHRRGDKLEEQDLQRATFVAVHELLHQYGLLHASSVRLDTENGTKYAIQLESGDDPRELGSYFAEAKYFEGGRQSDIMAGDTVASTNPVTLEGLHWPEKALDTEYQSPAREVGDAWTVFDGEDALAGQFGLISLPESINIGELRFGKLVVVPRPLEGQKGYGVWSAELFLIDDNYPAVATFGFIDLTGTAERREWTVTSGGHPITMKFADDKLHLRIEQ